MKTLIVCSQSTGKLSPFVLEQAESLKAQGVEADYFTVRQKGLSGYLKSRFPQCGNDRMERFTVSHNVGTTKWMDLPFPQPAERPNGWIYPFRNPRRD